MHLVAPGQGHIVTTRGCMGDLIAQFIIERDFADIDTACIAQMAATPYFLTLTGPQP
jgi:hypothetical protein